MIEIIPAMDIISGKCVRLQQGNFNLQKEYPVDPVDKAQKFEAAGLRNLHIVDLDGARHKKIINWKTLQDIAKATSLKIDFGGGVQSQHDCDLAFSCGADQVVVGSLAVRNPHEVQSWIRNHSPGEIILGMDVIGKNLAVAAWQEKTQIEISQFLEMYLQAGIQRVICTDVSKDGMLSGPAFSLYEEIKSEFPSVQLIASGGVGKISDVEKLCAVPVDGVIIGKALYEGAISLKDLAQLKC